MTQSNEKSDQEIYASVELYPDTASVLLRALSWYEHEINLRIGTAADHKTLGWIAERSPAIKPYKDELSKIVRSIQVIEQGNRIAKGLPVPMGNISHGLLRWYKAVGLRYVEFLITEVTEYSDRFYATQPILSSISEAVGNIQNMFNIGVFAEATPTALLL